MLSIEDSELFEQYYQNEYDFNTDSLSMDEIADIKRLAKEKRVDYAQAPIGTGVFSWILNQSSDIRFELVPFDSNKIDGMLYIPTTGMERAYIILNANKPLANQIFTAAHEFYHYIKDYQKFKESPYICDFSMLKDVNEKKASRFAAEILLPEGALYQEVNEYCRSRYITDIKNMGFSEVAALIIILTVKYQMPLKAVIYRLIEEKCIDSVDRYIDQYDFIKKVLQEIKIFKKRVNELYSKENNYALPYSSTYQDMEKAFLTGNASRENILEDAATLKLDMNLINDFLSENTELDDDDNDDELFSMINAKRRQ
ncbi:ImmA/IrrE family metallo-endopeptidase [Clostridium sp. MCC353]|uniref:ImmA/IrrE family metallo-endopeptidase n=1 Tax=Clostridium sp. MCC353 TaxID=2592646 RepID=UPI001C00B5F3|nr:ImmA/IrrE family metallo-endopeptidase [Clostridium sp. MCC353]